MCYTYVLGGLWRTYGIHRQPPRQELGITGQFFFCLSVVKTKSRLVSGSGDVCRSACYVPGKLSDVYIVITIDAQ